MPLGGCLLAISAIAETARQGIPFTLGVWSSVFPVGIWAMSACLLSRVSRSNIFRVVGAVGVAAHVVLWLVISVLSVQRAAAGVLHHPPNLAEQQPDGGPLEHVRSLVDAQLSQVLVGGGRASPPLDISRMHMPAGGGTTGDQVRPVAHGAV